MTHIELSISVKQNVNKTYKIIRKIEDFPKFMRNIKKIRIIESGVNKIVTQWNIDIDGVPVVWTQEDIFDDNKKTIKFIMIEGDYDKYVGEWKIEATSRGTEIFFTADFDWGIPVFEKFVGHILKRKASKSIKSMLLAIKQKLE